MKNPDGAIIVTAGQTSDVVGGVRFKCPPVEENCAVKITRVGDSIKVTSTGGMAEAILVPRDPPNDPKPDRTPGSQTTTQQQSGPTTALRIPDHEGNPRRKGKFHFTWLHGLQATPTFVSENTGEQEEDSYKKSLVFSIDDGEAKEIGRVKFSCTGQDCEVQVHRRSAYHFIIAYSGNVKATLLPFDKDKMFKGIVSSSHKYCIKDSTDDCNINRSFYEGYLDYPRYTLESNEILYSFGNPYILTEDRKTRIASNYGWQGKRYVINRDGIATNVNNRTDNWIELVIYTNADSPEDTNYLSYGRGMIIKPNGDWALDGVFSKSSGSTYGLGDLTGEVTYKGGATGWYALTDDLTDENGEKTNAGYFTARATFKADLNSDLTSNDNLLVEGTINKFVDQDGIKRDWSVVLQSNKFKDRANGNIGSEPPFGRTEWTINKKAADEIKESWSGHAADGGNSIHGQFRALYFTEGETKGRLNGAFGAEAERR